MLGLGDIGPVASLPVMEGKACLFKEFGGLDAVPIVLDTTDVDTIVETVAAMAPSFGGINLEDISAPRCFDIEARLRELLSRAAEGTDEGPAGTDGLHDGPDDPGDTDDSAAPEG